MTKEQMEKDFKLCLVQILKQSSEMIRLTEENCMDLRNDSIEKCVRILQQMKDLEEENLIDLPF